MAIKLRSLVKFPALVQTAVGLSLTKINGIYTFFFDFSKLTDLPSLPGDDSAKVLVYMPDPDPLVNGSYNVTKVTNLASLISSPPVLTGKTIDTADGNTLKIAGVPLTATTGTTKVVLQNAPTINDPVIGGISPASSTSLVVSGSATAILQAQSGGPAVIGSNSATTPVIFVSAGANRGSISATAADWLFGLPGVYPGSISIAGATSGSVKIVSPAVAGGAWTLPSAFDTFVGQAAAATLTNKTFDTAGGGNSLSINGVQVTANSGTGAVVRANAPSLVNPDVTTQTPGNNSTKAASTAYVDAALGGGAGVVVAPQGRITLTSGVAVMGASVAGATAVFYTPCVGNLVPLYDGTKFSLTAFPEVSQSTTDATKSPAAVAASSVYDLFCWNDGGVLRCTRGPAWTNDTTRSAGTARVIVNGIYLNSVAITNGPAAQRGTWVGTIASNASSSIDFIFGSVASGGGAASFHVWNAYNRVPFGTLVATSVASWTYTVAATWRAPNGSSTMRCSVVRGANSDPVDISYSAVGLAGSGANLASGIGLDSTTTYVGLPGFAAGTAASQQFVGSYSGLIGVGRHYLSALEYTSTSATATLVGAGDPAYIQAGLRGVFWQ